MTILNNSIGAICLSIAAASANAALIGGVEFPDGSVSFADTVVSYAPGSGVSAPHNNPNAALGIPDTGEGSYVSLGWGGSLVLRFVDNSLTTSGTSDLDLWVFEIGAQVEPTDVDISINGLDWVSVGSVAGATSGIDIDQFIGLGVELDERYSFVRLTDQNKRQSGSPWAGADINAVGAIASADAVAEVPVPAAAWLFGSALFGLVAAKRRR